MKTPETKPTAPVAGLLLSERLKATAKDWHTGALNGTDADVWHCAARTYELCADMAAEHEARLLEVVAELRSHAAHLREGVDPALVYDWRNARADERERAADCIEAALRGE